MEQVLLMREIVVSVFKRFETIIMFFLKFLIGVFIFGFINNINMPLEQVAFLYEPPYGLPFVLLMGILFAVCQPTIVMGLLFVNISLQISGVPSVAVFIILFMLLVMFFYVRLAPKECMFIVAVYFAFYFKLPYVVPLVAGLYFSLTTIIPIAIGVFAWYFVPVAAELLKQGGKELSLMEIPASFGVVYASVFESVNGKAGWIFTAFIFAMMVLVVFAISRSTIDHAKDIGIGIGAAVCVVSYIVAIIVADLDVDILPMILMTLVSVGIAEAIRFFDIVLDYHHAERVSFEDESNYYIVKIVPKVVLSKRRRHLRRIVETDEEAEEGMPPAPEDYEE